MSGDMCESVNCGDIASPGHSLCPGCLADRQAERDITAREAHRLTVEHEARVGEQDEVSA